MTNNEKQYYIYLRSTNDRVPCTKEEFDNYYHGIHTFRMTQSNRGSCKCPKRNELYCDMDCLTCKYHSNTNFSLDVLVNDDDDEKTWVDMLEDPSPILSDIIADTERLKVLFQKLNTLMPEAITIGKLRELGLTEKEIGNRIGLSRQTYQYRLNKVKKALEEEFSEFF